MPGRQAEASDVGFGDDHRLVARQAARQPRKLARVANGLKVEAHGGRVGVVLPVLHDVVTRNVSAVACGQERGQPQSTAAGGRVHRHTHGGRLAEQAKASPGRHGGGHGRVQGHGRVGVQDPEGFRTDHAHAVGPCPPNQLMLACQTPLAVVGKSCRGHNDPLDSCGGTFVHHLGHFVIGNGDDGQLDGPRNFGQFRKRDHAGELERLRIDCIDRSLEAAFNDVLEQLIADGPPFAAGTDDSHRRRRQQVAYAARLGAVLTGLHDCPRFFRGVDVELDAHHAVVKVALEVIPGVGEDHQHLAVVRQDLGGEPPDAVLPCSHGEVLQEDRTDAAPLVGVGNVEGHLGFAGIIKPVVAAYSHDFATDGDHERHAVDVVDFGEAPHFLAGQFGLEGKEPHVDGRLRLTCVESLQSLGVLGPDRAEVGRSAVAQHDIGLPIFRINADAGLIHHRLSLAKTSAVQLSRIHRPHGPQPIFRTQSRTARRFHREHRRY
ncbi:hypothetical protein PJL18_03484 [Paenarthrobacter nicotinovorans]|nr:hypothetical protein [Paenarthrobacter nicotinovorans]